MRFTKVNGLGNDYCVFNQADALDWSDEQWSDLARLISDRTSGIGSDGVLVIGPGAAHEDCVSAASMRVFNTDGSPGEMCGNGLRCVGRLLVEQGRARAGGSQGFVIATDAGLRTLWVNPEEPESVRTTMGQARFGPKTVGADSDHLKSDDIEPDCWSAEGESFQLVSVGNPHAIIITDDPLSLEGLSSRGGAIENAETFPDRINAQFVRIIDRDNVIVQSWERGSGATEACGTGAAAVVAALHKADLVSREVVVTLPGGDLTIEVGPDGMIIQTGPAEIEFEGDWPIG